MEIYKLNKKYKDRVFRRIFNNSEELLKLYNAVNNSDYTDSSKLTITTIDDIVYMGMKNDLSFVIGDVMNLYEHQSSFSPNLPLRGLFYFASLYREHIEPVKKRLYTDAPLYIPFPQYLVFYNGTKEEPERQELKLSDLFIGSGKRVTPALECTVIMLNINLGCNQELMDKCKRLKEYAQFIATIRKYAKVEKEFESAVETAVDECIGKGILADVLLKNKAEVIDMILTEWDEDEFRDFLKEEAWKQGHEAGKSEGIEAGIKAGRIEGTIKTCMKLGVPEEKVLESLMEEYVLPEDEAKEYMKKYWT